MSICRNFVYYCIFLNEVRPVELRGEGFPALFFTIIVLVGGFHKKKKKLPVTSGLGFWPVCSDFGLYLRFLGCIVVIFLFFFKSVNRRKVYLVNLDGSRMPPSKMAFVKIAPPIIKKYHSSGILVVKSQKNTHINIKKSITIFG